MTLLVGRPCQAIPFRSVALAHNLRSFGLVGVGGRRMFTNVKNEHVWAWSFCRNDQIVLGLIPGGIDFATGMFNHNLRLDFAGHTAVATRLTSLVRPALHGRPVSGQIHGGNDHVIFFFRTVRAH